VFEGLHIRISNDLLKENMLLSRKQIPGCMDGCTNMSKTYMTLTLSGGGINMSLPVLITSLE
jgi:hypothetical protein